MTVNQVFLVGVNLTRDAETKIVGENTVTKFSVAVNRQWKNQAGEKQEAVDFIDVESWGLSEKMREYLTKGKRIAIQGELRQNRWEKDGKTQSKIFVVARNILFMGGAGDGGKKGHEQRPATKIDLDLDLESELEGVPF